MSKSLDYLWDAEYGRLYVVPEAFYSGDYESEVETRVSWDVAADYARKCCDERLAILESANRGIPRSHGGA